MCFAKEEVPQSELLGFHFQFFDHWNDSLPARIVLSRQLVMSELSGRQDLVLERNKSDIQEGPEWNVLEGM